MKTMYGITFQQLHSLETDHLNDLKCSFIIEKMKEGLTKEPPFDNPKIRDRFIQIGIKYMSEMLHSTMVDSTYEAMRKIYDTEERFSIAVELLENIGDISTKCGDMMKAIFDQIVKEGLLD